MDPHRPFLLLRARPKPAARDRFAYWFRTTHLRDVANIPGIGGVESGHTAGGVHLGFYAFESSEHVQGALASPQAAYARGTWQQWAPDLDELLIEIWAPLAALPLYHSSS